MMGTRRTRARNREIAPGFPLRRQIFRPSGTTTPVDFTSSPASVGLGNLGFGNATCLITTLATFGGATPADCIANNQRLSELTIGFWQNVYKGDYGRVTFGAQYEYIKRKAFNGIGAAPSTDDDDAGGLDAIQRPPYSPMALSSRPALTGIAAPSVWRAVPC